MNSEITRILDEARRAPSVLNSQPWKFRVCGNTIEVYLKRQPELETIDPHGRLQLASCGTLVAYLSNAIRQAGWTPRVNYFPRFEEEDLVAFVEIKDSEQKIPRESKSTLQAQTVTESKHVTAEVLQEGLAGIASQKAATLQVHEDGSDQKLRSYFREQCGQMMDNDSFRKSLNMFLRPGQSDHSTSYADEALLSDRFFESNEQHHGEENMKSLPAARFLILLTDTDNRYAWIRSGEVLGDSLMYLKEAGPFGLMALPIIINDCCRTWLQKELGFTGFPQFVFTMKHTHQQDHIRKRPLNELLKYGI